MAVILGDAQRRLGELIERVNRDHTEIEIVSSSASAVLMSKAEYDALVETSYLLSSPANARRLMSALQSVRETATHRNDIGTSAQTNALLPEG